MDGTIAQRGRDRRTSRHARAWAVAASVGLLTVSLGFGPAIASTDAAGFEVEGDEISGWWWLRDAAGSQQAHWVFDGIPQSGAITLLFELLATDRASGGPGVDARFWLEYGPIVDGEELDAVTAPALIVLPNVSPPEDPLGYWTRGWFGFPVEALAWSAASGLYRQRAQERGGVPGSTPVDGLWVRIG